MSCSDFFIYESVQIENDSLKMDDKSSWWLTYSGFFGDIDFFITKIASEIAN